MTNHKIHWSKLRVIDAAKQEVTGGERIAALKEYRQTGKCVNYIVAPVPVDEVDWSGIEETPATVGADDAQKFTSGCMVGVSITVAVGLIIYWTGWAFGCW